MRIPSHRWLSCSGYLAGNSGGIECFSLQKSFLSLILKDYVLVGILENDRLFGATLLQWGEIEGERVIGGGSS